MYSCNLYNNKQNINKIEKIENSYKKVNNMQYNKDYGVIYDSENTFNIAIPYRYVDTPVLNSTFTDIFIKIITTTLSYLKLTDISILQSVFLYNKYLRKNDKIRNYIYDTCFTPLKGLNLDENIIADLLNTDENLQSKLHKYINGIYKTYFVKKCNLYCDLITNIVIQNSTSVNSMNCINSYDIIMNNSNIIGMTGTP